VRLESGAAQYLIIMYEKVSVIELFQVGFRGLMFQTVRKFEFCNRYQALKSKKILFCLQLLVSSII
jgi:hypothetical protein